MLIHEKGEGDNEKNPAISGRYETDYLIASISLRYERKDPSFPPSYYVLTKSAQLGINFLRFLIPSRDEPPSMT